MNLKLETEFSKAPILQEVDFLKKQIDDMRPLPLDIEGRVMQKLRLEWNYNSNAIEGNKLSYGETTALLMHGITAKGKPLKDHLDIKGHNKAVEYLESIVKDDRDFTESDIRGLHEVILGESYDSPAQTAEGLPTSKQIQIGKYKSMPNHVQTITGEIHYYATPEETPAKMADLMNWYYAIKKAGIHPLVICALFHHRFVAIHPFDDGNGRMARILMNLILMRNGYPPVVIKKDDRQNYYSLLSQADSGEDLPFIEYIADRLKSSLELYVKVINGGDIDEDEDIDKEITLLKIQLNGGVSVKEKKSNNSIQRVFTQDIIPLANKVIHKLKDFENNFFSSEKFFSVSVSHDLGDFIYKVNVDNNSLKAYLKPLNEQSFEVENITTLINYKDYKNEKNLFNVHLIIKTAFNELDYNVFVNNKMIISKYYHENLLPADVSQILKEIIYVFKSQF